MPICIDLLLSKNSGKELEFKLRTLHFRKITLQRVQNIYSLKDGVEGTKSFLKNPHKLGPIRVTFVID